jgi:hypothetical protein
MRPVFFLQSYATYLWMIQQNENKTGIKHEQNNNKDGYIRLEAKIFAA